MSDESTDSVLLAHPSILLVESLGHALASTGMTDVRRAGDLETSLAALRSRPAQLTLCGSELARAGIGRLVAEMLEAGSHSVVVLAPAIEERHLLEALEAGALGYVSREEPLDRLLFDVRGALRGEACLPRDKLAPVLRLLIDRRREQDEQAARLSRLSKREHEVLSHLAAGDGNDEIAAALFLSQATVRTHVQNILTKLGAHSRLEAVAVALQYGVASTGPDTSERGLRQ